MSKTGYVYACSKIAVPPAKPKYIYTIDSVKVPWGNAEKVLSLKGSEKNLKYLANKQLKLFDKFCRVTAYLLHNGSVS